MTIFVYTATQSISSGHALGVTYQVDFDVQSSTRKSMTSREVSRSLSGKTETLINRVDVSYDITFAPVNGNKRLLLEEMLDSISDGQSIFVYLYGSESSPLTVICESESYSESDFMPVGSAETDYITAQCTLRVAQ